MHNNKRIIKVEFPSFRRFAARCQAISYHNYLYIKGTRVDPDSLWVIISCVAISLLWFC